MSQQWYILNNGEFIGPHSEQKLRELAGNGEIQCATKVIGVGMDKPTLAGKVPGLVFPSVQRKPAVRVTELLPPVVSTAAKNTSVQIASREHWYVRPPTGGQYGPASREVIQDWLRDGRIDANAQLWCEGWADWRAASTIFPELAVSVQPPIQLDVTKGQANQFDARAKWVRDYERWDARVHRNKMRAYIITSLLAAIPIVGLLTLMGLEGQSGGREVDTGTAVGAIFAGAILGIPFAFLAACLVFLFPDKEFGGLPPPEPAQLYACPTCGQGVSNYAAVCPYCGHVLQVQQQQRRMGVFLVQGVDVNNDGETDFYAGFGG